MSIQLLVTSTELKEIREVLKSEPVREGFYYYKQRPLELFRVNTLMVAVLDYQSVDKPSVTVNYQFNMPAWKRTVPDIIKHVAAR